MSGSNTAHLHLPS